MVGLTVSSAYLATWYQLVERSTCESTAMLGCAGPSIVMLLVGVPLCYIALALGLRLARAPLPWLAPLAVVVGVFVLAQVTDAVAPPLWLWPAAVGVLCALWAMLGRRATSPREAGAP
jgi:purine-cytosine permease-like protein